MFLPSKCVCHIYMNSFPFKLPPLSSHREPRPMECWPIPSRTAKVNCGKVRKPKLGTDLPSWAGHTLGRLARCRDEFRKPTGAREWQGVRHGRLCSGVSSALSTQKEGSVPAEPAIRDSSVLVYCYPLDTSSWPLHMRTANPILYQKLPWEDRLPL